MHNTVEGSTIHNIQEVIYFIGLWYLHHICTMQDCTLLVCIKKYATNCSMHYYHNIKISSNRHLVVEAVADPLDSHQVCKVDRTADASLVDLACVGSVGRARPPFCTWHTWSLIGNAPMVRHNAHNY